MFAWLFGRGRESRFVFRYRDGKKNRSADPVEVERILEAHLGASWRGDLGKLTQPLPLGLIGVEAAEARKKKDEYRVRVMEAVNKAFDVRPYRDGEGLTEVERLSLLNGFILFCIDLVRAARPFASAPSRASPSPESPTPSSGPESSSPEGKSVASGSTS